MKIDNLLAIKTVCIGLNAKLASLFESFPSLSATFTSLNAPFTALIKSFNSLNAAYTALITLFNSLNAPFAPLNELDNEANVRTLAKFPSYRAMAKIGQRSPDLLFRRLTVFEAALLAAIGPSACREMLNKSPTAKSVTKTDDPP